MASLSLFPMFLDPLGGGSAGGDGFILELLADPDITLEPDISIELNTDNVEIEIEKNIEIEAD